MINMPTEQKKAEAHPDRARGQTPRPWCFDGRMSGDLYTETGQTCCATADSCCAAADSCCTAADVCHACSLFPFSFSNSIPNIFEKFWPKWCLRIGHRNVSYYERCSTLAVATIVLQFLRFRSYAHEKKCFTFQCSCTGFRNPSIHVVFSHCREAGRSRALDTATNRGDERLHRRGCVTCACSFTWRLLLMRAPLKSFLSCIGILF